MAAGEVFMRGGIQEFVGEIIAIVIGAILWWGLIPTVESMLVTENALELILYGLYLTLPLDVTVLFIVRWWKKLMELMVRVFGAE